VTVRVVAIVAALTIASVAACVPPRRATPGGACLFNGDCDSPLVCAGRQCRVPCRTMSDCTAGQVCRPARPGLSVCVPPGDPPLCGADLACESPLVCANDGYCHPICRLDYDCRFSRPGTVCLAGLCVERDAGAPDAPPVDAPAIDAPGIDATDAPAVDTIATETFADVVDVPPPFEAGDGPAFDVPPDADLLLRPRVTGGAGRHRCVVDTAGQIVCFGNCTAGGCGIGAMSPARPTVATAFPAGRTWIGIEASEVSSAANDTTCALDMSGAVYCVGYGATGQLGDGTMANSVTAVPVSGLADATQIAMEWGHACAVRRTGAVACWGNAALGSAGVAAPSATPVAVDSLSDAVEIGVGRDHACARRMGGSVVCWGANALGQLGDGTTNASLAPVAAVGITTAVQLSVGERTSCVRLMDGTARCWGQNDVAQIGTGSASAAVTSPAVVVGVTGILEILASGGNTCAIRAARDVVCWGWAQRIGMISGSTGASPTPTVVMFLRDARHLTAGPFFDVLFHETSICAVRGDGVLLCWGDNSGQLGLPESAYDLTFPIPVLR